MIAVAGEATWIAPWLLAFPGLVGLFAMETRARPRGLGLSRRSIVDIATVTGLWLLVYGLLTLILGRGGLALGVGWALLGGLIAVNNAKEALLREPLLFDDYDYLVDTLRHPRLFLPYLGSLTLWLGAGGATILVAAGLTLEPDWVTPVPAAAMVAVGVLIMASGQWHAARDKIGAGDENPRQAIRRYGLFATLAGTAIRALTGQRPASTDTADISSWAGRVADPANSDPLPHRIVVQSESFLDPRGRISGVRDDVLPAFDALAATGVTGRLRVPAFGANTVRSEYAFLSGIAPAAMSHRRLNPYRHVRPGRLDASLVWSLKAGGYRTVCVHPYAGGFYGRDRVMPLLGFDEFVDGRAFPQSTLAGGDSSPYVSDAAVGNWVLQRLAQGNQPLFVFVVTMENHGPLHLESLRPDEAARYLTGNAIEDSVSLDKSAVTYLRHLANADRMLGRLAEGLNASPRGGRLCCYGDHPPILPATWAKDGYPGRWTDYLLWSTGDHFYRNCRTRRTERIEKLGACFLSA